MTAYSARSATVKAGLLQLAVQSSLLTGLLALQQGCGSPPAAPDLTAPQTYLVSASEAGPTRATAITFELGCSEQGAALQCQLDGAGWAACGSVAHYTGLAEGPHAFAARCQDSAGNLDPTPVTWAWDVDLTPPDTVIAEGPPEYSASSTALFRFACSEDPCTYRCQLDGGSWSACSGELVFAGLAEAEHRLIVVARDEAGNTDASAAEYEWRVDMRPPVAYIWHHPNEISQYHEGEFVVVSEPGCRYYYHIDAGATQISEDVFSEGQVAVSYTGLEDGYHQFAVSAVDQAGNSQQSPTFFAWYVATQPPRVRILDAPTDPSVLTDPIFSFVCEHPGCDYMCRLDEREWGQCSTEHQVYGAQPGRHALTVYAVDIFGRAGPVVAHHWWMTPVISSYNGALSREHSIWNWGAYLGNGQSIFSTSSFPVREGNTFHDWMALSRWSRSCAVRADSSLWCWGSNAFGGLLDFSYVDQLIPTPVKALKLSYGGDYWPPKMRYRTASAGANMTCALAIKESASTVHHGSILCWADRSHSCGIDTVYLPVALFPSSEDLWVSLDSGINHHCGIGAGGWLKCWGDNSRGQHGDGTTEAAYDFCRWYHQQDSGLSQEASASTDWLQVSAGAWHTCALKRSGELWCWGDNRHGQLGDGSTDSSSIPIRIDAAGVVWEFVSAGGDRTCGLAVDRTLWCWGFNNGLFGIGPAGDVLAPQPADGASDWVYLSTASTFTCGVKADGGLWCWGDNRYGQLGDGSTEERAAPVLILP